MEVRDYVKLLRRHWLLISALSVLGVAAALGYSLWQTPQYQATSAVFVSTQQTTTVQDLNQGSVFTQQVVKSYADVVTRPIVLDPVISSLGLKITAPELASKIDAEAPADTVVLQISVTDSSPVQAVRIANAVSAELSSVVAQLTPPSNGGTSPVKISNIEKASVPTTPISPKVPLNIVLGLAAGFVLAFAIALLRDRLDTRIRTIQDVVLATRSPILGAVAYDPSAAAFPLIVHSHPHSTRAESYRSLRTNLQFLAFEKKSRVIVLTSSVPGEGKSTSVANLAIAISNTGARVLLVDGDLRRPKLADYLAVDGSVGLTDVLIGSLDLDEALQPWGDSGLTLLPAGHIPPNPSELLQSNAMMTLITELRSRFDTVIFDAPPLLPVTDGAILANRSDGAILVCAAMRTNRHQVTSAVDVLTQVGATILGSVVTMMPRTGPDAYGYEYGYSYGIPPAPVTKKSPRPARRLGASRTSAATTD